MAHNLGNQNADEYLTDSGTKDLAKLLLAELAFARPTDMINYLAIYVNKYSIVG